MQILRDFLKTVLMFLFLFPAIFLRVHLPLLLAMGEKPPREVERENQEEKAEKALEALRRAYGARSLSEFFEWVSDDYRQGWADLRSDIASQFTGTGSSDLNFVLNRTLTEGDKTALQVHWQKRTMDSKTGRVEKSEGNGEFIFQTVPDGKPQLIDIRGQSPF